MSDQNIAQLNLLIFIHDRLLGFVSATLGKLYGFLISECLMLLRLVRSE
tara:strand:+ start:348 stop:494 length:147 start_codon:yes stop_codon:yes gene_type:complete